MDQLLRSRCKFNRTSCAAKGRWGTSNQLSDSGGYCDWAGEPKKNTPRLGSWPLTLPKEGGRVPIYNGK